MKSARRRDGDGDVASGTDKSEAELKPAGDKLEAKGIRLTSGSKVVASVTTGEKK